MRWGNQKPPVGYEIDWGLPINKDLVGWWLLNERGGNRCRDLVRPANNGTLSTGGVWAPGFHGPAISFNGTAHAWTTASSPPGLDFAGNFTVAFWAKTVNNSDVVNIAAKRTVGIENWVFLQNGNGAKVGIYDGTTFFAATGSKTFGDSRYHCVVGMRWSGNLYLYIDGVFDALASLSGIGSVTCTGPVTLGSDGVNASYFNGTLDNLRMWNRALTDRELADMPQHAYYGIREIEDVLPYAPAAAAGTTFPQLERNIRGLNRGLVQGVA